MEDIKRIGICRSRSMQMPALFHRIEKQDKSTIYRVWSMPGSEKHHNMLPQQFYGLYKVVKDYKPIEQHT